jgi:hypothetical protein
MGGALREVLSWGDERADDCVERVSGVLHRLAGEPSVLDDSAGERGIDSITRRFDGAFSTRAAAELSLLAPGNVTVVLVAPPGARRHVVLMERQRDGGFTLVETQGIAGPESIPFDLDGPLPAALAGELQLIVDSGGALAQLEPQDVAGRPPFRLAEASAAAVMGTDPGTVAALLDPPERNQPGMRRMRALLGGIARAFVSRPETAAPEDLAVVQWLRAADRQATTDQDWAMSPDADTFHDLAGRPREFWLRMRDDRAAALVRLRRELRGSAARTRAVALDRLRGFEAQYPNLEPAELLDLARTFLRRAILVSRVPASMLEDALPPDGIEATLTVLDWAPPPSPGEVILVWGESARATAVVATNGNPARLERHPGRSALTSTREADLVALVAYSTEQQLDVLVRTATGVARGDVMEFPAYLHGPVDRADLARVIDPESSVGPLGPSNPRVLPDDPNVPSPTQLDALAAMARFAEWTEPDGNAFARAVIRASRTPTVPCLLPG